MLVSRRLLTLAASRAAPPPAASLGAAAAVARRFAASASADPEALGFSSPGNSGDSEEMREVGDRKEVSTNERAHQMHSFSEKDRFDAGKYANAEPGGGLAAAPGDTAPERAVGAASRKLGQQGAAAARNLNIAGHRQFSASVVEGEEEGKAPRINSFEDTERTEGEPSTPAPGAGDKQRSGAGPGGRAIDASYGPAEAGGDAKAAGRATTGGQEQSAEGLDPDEVMEKRMEDHTIGGYST